MARIQPQTPEEMPAEVRQVLEWIEEKQGAQSNLFRTLARCPSLMTSLAGHFTAVFETGTVSPQLKEMLAVRVSQVNDCAY